MKVDLLPITEVPQDVARYVAELRRINVNGDVIFARWKIVPVEDDFEAFLQRDRWYEHIESALQHPAVRAQWPELVNTGSFEPGARRLPGTDHELPLPVFESLPTLLLDGYLAADLVSGGAYERWRDPVSEARALATRVRETLFGDRYDEVMLFRSSCAWSNWFHDVAWDVTYILFDFGAHELTLLCSTDTD